MSSQPDLPCGEEEEVDREEKRKKGKGEKTGKVLKWTCSHKFAHKEKQLKVQKLLEAFDKTLR